jgi:putative two-component system response regulator
MTDYSGATVLVVDDEPAARRLATRLLVRHGFRCMEAATAEEALELLAESTPDLVLTDVNLPGPSGITLLNALSPLQPQVAAVVVSGSGSPDTAYRALNAGAFGYVRKPFDDHELLVALDAALRRRALAIDDRAARDELEERIALQTHALEESRLEAIERLARTVELRDGGTGAHVDRMSALAYRLARVLGWSGDDAETLRIACALHDVGKVGVPDGILLKEGSLTSAERERIEQHCEVGRAILAGAKSELLQLAEVVAWTHHERVDGSGYPRGLSGDEIPLAGRIAAVADVYDALTSDRPYRRAFSPAESLEIVRHDAGLDAAVVAALERVVGASTS